MKRILRISIIVGPDVSSPDSFRFKGKYFCLISVEIDSSCDDEEAGHIPSEFWFTIYCRENKKNGSATGLGYGKRQATRSNEAIVKLMINDATGCLGGKLRFFNRYP